MVYFSDRADFGFKIEFARDTEDPSRVFRSFLRLIEFCRATDKTLIESLDIAIKSDIILDNIEQGSITLWLKNAFKSVKDNCLEKFNENLISDYLIESKSSIIEFINERQTINNSSELLSLKDKLKSYAQKTNVNNLGIYTPPNDKELLLSIDNFQEARDELQAADQLYYLTPYSNLPVNHDFSISQENIENLLVQDTFTSEQEMILKIKKPDYLGESKWEFRHGKKAIDAKIIDREWLKMFRHREIIIAPGDSIRAKVKIVTQYDAHSELISSQHTIEKVIAVIPMSRNDQLSSFKDKKLKG